MTTDTARGTLRFAEYLLDLERRILFRGDERVRLTGKPFVLLMYFATHPGTLLSKEELLGAVWSGQERGENNLHKAVQIVREALLDTEPRRFVRNEPVDGYRFIAPVTGDGQLQEDSPDGLPGEELIDLLETTYLVVPAQMSDIQWAAKLASRVYSGIHVIPPRLMLEWYRVNPTGFSVIKRSDGSLTGNFDLLPVRDEVMKRFVRGEITERDLRGDCIHPARDRDRVTDLYVESFVCVDAFLHANAHGAFAALAAFEVMAERVCDVNKLGRVFALAASSNGRHLLDVLGFHIVSPAAVRKDKRDLYSIEFRTLAAKLRDVVRRKRRDPTIERLIPPMVRSRGL